MIMMSLSIVSQTGKLFKEYLRLQFTEHLW